MNPFSLLSLAALLALLVVVHSHDTYEVGTTVDGVEQQQGRGGWAPGRKIDPKTMTDEESEEFQKEFGINPRKAEARMERLRSRGFKNPRNVSKSEEERKERIANKYGHMKTEKPNANETVDLFEVNKESGVDDLLVEGDMNLTDEQFAELEKEEDSDSSSRAKRQVTKIYSKWTGNTVYYFFDSSINSTKKSQIFTAMYYIQSRTCINFVLSYTATNRIRFISGAGCYSSVGMVGGQQDISIGNGCEVIGTVVHEILHALGVFHFQSRYDRDSYVSIYLSNVPTDKQHNFVKYTSTQTINYTPYEYGSTMHYGANAFVSTAGTTSILPFDDDYLFTMGNRQVSFYDIQLVNSHYACSCSTGATCYNGGVRNPRNCSQCLCPLGYSGASCSSRPFGCGSTLAATTSWQTTLIQVGENTQVVRQDFTLCTSWITAPSGRTIQVILTSVYNGQCNYGCPYNGIELKTKSDRKMASPRYCCSESTGTVISSSLNPTPIIAFNRYSISQFQVQYRYI